MKQPYCLLEIIVDWWRYLIPDKNTFDLLFKC